MSKYKPDCYAKKAKQEGFVARSVYKLQDIQKKFHILQNFPPQQKTNQKTTQKILDLGSAPGSWTQYILRFFPNSSLVSVDLQALNKDVLTLCKTQGATFIQGDFTDPVVISNICTLGPYDCILSDAAPSTTGNRTVDTAASEVLVETAFYFVTHTLKQSGFFVTKIFEGAGIQNIITHMQKHFSKVSRYTPRAVKQKSFEQYLIGRNPKFFGDI